jgi:hypothetical protein
MYEQRLEKTKEGREYVLNYFLTHPCVDCGETDPRVLEFDHIHGRKRMEVSKLIRNGHSIEVIQAEIDKCVVRCSNCHKKRTYKGSWRDVG